MQSGRFTLCVLLLACLLSACGSRADSGAEGRSAGGETPPAQTAEADNSQEETEIGEDGAMISDIGSWQARRSESFGQAYDRMNAGGAAARLDFEFQTEAGATEDQDLVFETFTLLSNLNVYTNRGYSAPETEETDRFTFSWPDGLTCTFCFSDGEVFHTEDLLCYDTFAYEGDMDYMEIRGLFLDRYHGLRPEGPEPQDSGSPEPADTLAEDLDFSDDFFEWDADGDGNAEKFEINFYRNGDEAQDVLEITVVSGGSLEGEQIMISGAYEVTGLTSGTDGEGPVLTLFYLAGDYYSHDVEAKCEIRLRNGVLETENPEQ